MTVLYRKYRPRTFAEVAGQEHVKTALANEAATGRIAHSYLFSGPRGVGKTSLARIFAKAVNCGARSKEGDPCGSCVTCQEIAEGRALDVIEIDAASHTGVDNVREQVIENARFAPTKLAYKVFIIDEAHMLSTSAFNALLKTLEEPPEKVVFVLATTELHKLPATVVSRCQRFDFRKIPARTLIDRLERLAADEGVTVDAEVMETVARLSEGCLRDAESLLGQLFALGEKNLTAQTAALVLPMISAEAIAALLKSLSAKDAGVALAAWEDLMSAGADPIRVVSELSEICRSAMLKLVKGEPVEGLILAEAAALLERLIRAMSEMKRLDPPELGFELLLVEWCAAAAERVQGKREPPKMPPPTGVKREETPKAAVEPAVPEHAGAPTDGAIVSLENVKSKWGEVLAAAQTRDHGLPFMLGVAELLDCAAGTLTIGFQYALYRDRLNDRRHRETFEAALCEALGATLRVKAVLVARTDAQEGLETNGVDVVPNIIVTPAAKLPDGFAELVKEFGGTVA
jgi:DNA polymerase-3 subunit gamma/tau